MPKNKKKLKLIQKIQSHTHHCFGDLEGGPDVNNFLSEFSDLPEFIMNRSTR